jgi:hypothetical protein
MVKRSVSKSPIPQKLASQRIDALETAPASSGKTKLLKYLCGDTLTRDGAIKSHCCDCMGYYVDGKFSCETPMCSLFPFMPYRGKIRKEKDEDAA